MRKRNVIYILMIVASIVAVPVALAQSEPARIAPDICPERYSVYEDGVLIYQCEIVDLGSGQYVVRETQRDGTVSQRIAAPLEVSGYVAAVSERECTARKQIARDAIQTPIARIDLESLAARITTLENAIAECVR